jgi:DNA polymerase III delta prime subunit
MQIIFKPAMGNLNQGFPQVTILVKPDQGSSTVLEGQLPPSPMLPTRYKNWQQSYRLLVSHPRRLSRIKKVEPPSPDQCRQFAQTLQDEMNGWLNSVEFQAIKENLKQWVTSSASTPIQLIIQTADIELRRLPWHLWDFFPADCQVEVSLSPLESESLPMLTISVSDRIRKVRILGILGDSTDIDVQADKKAFWNLRGAYPHFFEQPTRNKLIQHLEERWDILFFSGHSETQSDGQSGLLYLNPTEELHINQIKDDLNKAITQGLQLAILNSCDGLGLARELEALKIPYVVVWREPVPDLVAQKFLKYFLFEYAQGKSLPAAVWTARHRLHNEWIELEEKLPGATWLPVICQNVLATPLHWDTLRRKPLHSIQSVDSNRQNLLIKVKRAWVEELLEKSLYSQVVIDLNLDQRISPNTLGRLTQETVDLQQRPLSPTKKVIDLFDEKGEDKRQLLILGEPGTGKTTTLLELARDLIECAEDDPTQPIPIVFNLSSWTDNQTIAAWLIEELHYEPYGVPKVLCRELVENEKLFLLLDGLDEVKAEYREACVKALNTFCRKYHQTELVVCSRVGDYDLLKNRLAFGETVFIQPLNPEQIEHYLDVAGRAKLSAVTALLPKDSTLQELAKYPATLNFMTYAYQGQTQLPKMESVEERRQDVFEKYVEMNLATDLDGQKQSLSYPKEKTTHWLTWLAQRMLQESQSVFLIERMQPTLLLSKAQRGIYRLLLLVISGLLGGIIGSLAGVIGTRVPSLESILSGFILGFIFGFIVLGLVFLRRYQDAAEEEKQVFLTIPRKHWSHRLLTLLSFGLIKFRSKKSVNKVSRKKFTEKIVIFYTLGSFGFLLQLLFTAIPSTFIYLYNYYSFSGGGEMVARIEPLLPFSLPEAIVIVSWIGFYIIVMNSPDYFISPKLAFKKVLESVTQLRKIEPVETLSFSFSWKRAWYSLKTDFGRLLTLTMTNPVVIIFSLILLFFMMLGIVMYIFIEEQIPSFKELFEFVFEVSAGTTWWAMKVLFEGIMLLLLLLGLFLSIWLIKLSTTIFVGTEIKLEEKNTPNQGILHAMKYLIISSIGGLVVLETAVLLSSLDNLVLSVISIASSVIIIIFWLSFGFGKAGRTIVQHISLRIVLYFTGHIPRNCGQFFDYASNRFFLRKVGGGYIFIHRSLQEHFAKRKALVLSENQTVVRDKHQVYLLNAIKTEIEEQLKILPNGISLNLPKTMAIGNQPFVPLSNEAKIIDAFDDPKIDGKLLILGDADSGKTVLLLELAKELLARAESDSSQPIPILLNLSSWKDKKKTYSYKIRKPPTDFFDRRMKLGILNFSEYAQQLLIWWIVEELSLNYGIQQELAKLWIYQRKLVFLFDNLHELDVESRADFIQATNHILEGEYKPQYLVVCDHTVRDYSYTRIELNAVIYLQPPTEAQVYQYLGDVKRIDLQQLVLQDSNFWEFAKSLPSLNMMVWADKLSTPAWQACHTQDARYQYLVDRYIESRLVTSSADFAGVSGKEMNTENVQHCLSLLAKDMTQQDQKWFLANTLLQPSWLQTRFQKWVYHSVLGVILGFVFGMIFGIVNGLGAGLVSAFSEKLWWTPLVGLLGGLWDGLVIGLIASLIVGLVAGINVLWFFGLVSGLIMIAGMIFFAKLKLLLEMIEELIIEQFGGNMTIFLFVLVFGLFWGMTKLVTAPSVWGSTLAVILVGGLLSLFLRTARIKTSQLTKKIQNRLAWGGVIGFIVGWFSWSDGNQLTLEENLIFWLWFVWSVALLTSPLAAIQHLALRITLNWFGIIPKNYTQFLHHLTNSLLVYKVGKQFRFIHPSVQKYFAQK